MPHCFRRLAATLLGSGAVLLLGASPVWAGVKPQYMTLGAAAPAPAGFRQFCSRTPEACVPQQTVRYEASPFGSFSRGGFSLRDLDRDLRDEALAGERLQTSAFSRGGDAFFAGTMTEIDADSAGQAEDGVARPIILPPIAALEIPSLEGATVGEAALGGAAPRITLTDDTRTLLTRVNRAVNRAVRPRSDMALTGRAEFWSLPVALKGGLFGDCEDYALQKKADLIDAGLPAAALTLAVVHTRRGEVHAVLVVGTDQGDLVLDNRSSWVLPWAAVDYRWVMRQVSGDAMGWARVAPLTAG